MFAPPGVLGHESNRQVEPVHRAELPLEFQPSPDHEVVGQLLHLFVFGAEHLLGLLESHVLCRAGIPAQLLAPMQLPYLAQPAVCVTQLFFWPLHVDGVYAPFHKVIDTAQGDPRATHYRVENRLILVVFQAHLAARHGSGGSKDTRKFSIAFRTGSKIRCGIDIYPISLKLFMIKGR